uniref:uncharacterized protein LOC122604499 n=1 Tax=Erigeron canadensis TaxID=72917 RepID=UPI001CB99CF0|nr:uncharacterized protein LOC122604499 [Erigeron canadensis]
MGFPVKWHKWVYGILSFARSSVLVNGSPTFEFQFHKGMRQGDPLAPLLFIIVMEALSVMFNKATEAGVIHGVEMGNDRLSLSHMLYVDDCVILGEWVEDNLINVARVLHIFNLCSGLNIHLGKSNLYGIGICDAEISNMAARINCGASSFPSNRLGIPIGANMNRFVNWNFLFDIFEARLARWKAISLYMAVADLGVLQRVKGEIGDGREIRFWLDSWISNDPLKVWFHTLFRLDKQKKVVVADFFDNATGRFNGPGYWANMAASMVEQSERDELFRLLQNVTLHERKDNWMWVGGKDKTFTMRAMKGLMISDRDFSDRYVFDWCKWVSNKCNIFVWRGIMERIPTMSALQTRNYMFGDPRCVLCWEESETAQHIFCECGVAAEVWQAVKEWCRTTPFMVFEIKDLMEFHE